MNTVRRFLSFFRRRTPGMIGTPPSARQVPADPGLHAVDFALRYAVPMNYHVEDRMMELGIDPNLIGSGDVDYGIRHAAFHPHGTIRRDEMLHNLTIGHMDTTLLAERGSRVLKPLDERILARQLRTLGERNGEGWKLGGEKVEFRNGCVIVPWLGGGTNYVAEEFALRMIRETGCQVIDREHCRLIHPEQLTGLTESGLHRPLMAGARRILRAMGMIG